MDHEYERGIEDGLLLAAKIMRRDTTAGPATVEAEAYRRHAHRTPAPLVPVVA